MSCDRVKWFDDLKAIIEEMVDRVLERKQPRAVVPVRWLLCCAASLAVALIVSWMTVEIVSDRFATTAQRLDSIESTIEQLKSAAHTHVMPRPVPQNWRDFRAEAPHAL